MIFMFLRAPAILVVAQKYLVGEGYDGIAVCRDDDPVRIIGLVCADVVALIPYAS